MTRLSHLRRNGRESALDERLAGHLEAPAALRTVETRGAPPFDPGMMVCLRLYAYGVGVLSSRKSARAPRKSLVNPRRHLRVSRRPIGTAPHCC